MDVIGSGRTDRGVHAKGQMANFHTSRKWKPSELKDKMNQYLPEDICILDCEMVNDRFHSRFNSVGKKYRYVFYKGYEGLKPVFDRKFVAVLDEPVDIQKMQEAACRLTGKHDFRGFSRDRTKKSTVRRINRISIREDGNYIVIEYVGNGFLHHMVRILTGTLVEIGTGMRDPKTIEQIFNNRIREEAGYLVPAQGLTLAEVYYEKKDIDDQTR